MKNSSFIRKIVYVIIIAVLVLPLSFISRPASRGKEADDGGKLAQLRTEYDLSQANLMEIDPASETMKLATLGLRGVAVNALWMQANEQKKKEDWDGMAATLQALIKVQPNFVRVWEFQAHNLSYNISMEFDDYEYRYHWVKKGIAFLEEGIPYNRKDHRMFDHLGFFTGMKIARSDEKVEFRRMFREDTEFHELMAHRIDPSRYFEGENYGYDNWKMAWNWYQLSRELAARKGITQQTADVLYFAKRPAQLRNEAQSLNDEFKANPFIQDIWQASRDEWIEYGRMQINNTLNVSVTLEGMIEYGEDLERKRDELDALAPGTREKFTQKMMEDLGFTEVEKLILEKPIDERDDAEAQIANRLGLQMLEEDRIIDVRVMDAAPENEKLRARRLVDDIIAIIMQMRAIEQQSGVSNYRYWRIRTECEASEITVRARRALYDAQQAANKSVFDDEYIVDRKTGEKTITQKGAITLYEESFKIWAEVFEQFPRLRSGDLGDQIMEEVIKYGEMLDISGIDWKDDFPLQVVVDVRAENGENDGIPTSQFLNERRADREEELEEQMERGDQSSNEEPADDDGIETPDDDAVDDASQSPDDETVSDDDSDDGDSDDGDSGDGDSGDDDSGDDDSGDGDSGDE